ncbi:MAG: serine hydrolase domain-containing protein [Polyangiales bacterium]
MRAVIDGAIAARVTPGAALAVSWRDGARVAAGHPDVRRACVTTPPRSRPRRATTSSLTKPFTAWAAARLAHRGALDLAAPLADTLPRAANTPVGACSLEDLLAHRAGLAAWRPLYAPTDPARAGAPETRAAMLDAVVAEPAGPTPRAVYSDLGYILAGEALAARHGGLAAALDVAEVLGALRFGPVPAEACAPTEDCAWRGRVLRGEVHDENAFALGGVAGHAGLFGDAPSVCARGEAMLDALRGGDAVETAMLRPREGGTHRLGWDTRSPQGSSAGARMGPRTFGHLGFTGTSLWCDPDVDVAVALLTNRVHPTRAGDGIRALRPAVHDAVREALGR